MIQWMSRQGWWLLQYPIQILFNGVLLWLVLNRLAPPRMVIDDGDDARAHKPVLRKIRLYPFLKCLVCSLLLFSIAFIAASPLFLMQGAYGQMIILRLSLFMLLFWIFGSRWAVSAVFEGTNGQQYAIFLFYAAISFGVDWAVRLFK